MPADWNVGMVTVMLKTYHQKQKLIPKCATSSWQSEDSFYWVPECWTRKTKHEIVIYQVKLKVRKKGLILSDSLERCLSSLFNKIKNCKFTDQQGIRTLNEDEDEHTAERSSISTPEKITCDSPERNASVHKYE